MNFTKIYNYGLPTFASNKDNNFYENYLINT